MLKTLRLVRGAVADKDLVPVLTHFHIYGGRIQGGNGRLTIDAPLPEHDFDDITVPADRFLKAVDGCAGEPNLKVTDAGALMVKKGSFRVRLPLADTVFPLVKYEGDETDNMQPVPGLLKLLRRINAFVGEDASRPWMCSVLIRDGFAYATNNPVIIKVPAPGIPDMVIPVFAVDELLRIGVDPQWVRKLDKALHFQLPDGVWLQCRMLEGEWPDVHSYFEDVPTLPEVPAGLKAAVERVLPFCPDSKFPVIQLSDAGVATADGTMSANVDGFDLPPSSWHAKNLLMVLGMATHMDFSAWPKPCYWSGLDGVVGVAVGLRK